MHSAFNCCKWLPLKYIKITCPGSCRGVDDNLYNCTMKCAIRYLINCTNSKRAIRGICRRNAALNLHV